MAYRKMAEGQTTINKTIHGKLKIEQHETHITLFKTSHNHQLTCSDDRSWQEYDGRRCYQKKTQRSEKFDKWPYEKGQKDKK